MTNNDQINLPYTVGYPTKQSWIYLFIMSFVPVRTAALLFSTGSDQTITITIYFMPAVAGFGFGFNLDT